MKSVQGDSLISSNNKDTQEARGQEPALSGWAEKQMATLSLRERIGQLFMVAAYSNRGPEHEAELKKQIQQYGIGGLIFFQGGPKRQIAMQNRLQKSAKLPLLIGIDAEWGLNMRLDSTFGFQRQMTIGATQNPILAQDVGSAIGRQCRAMDIHVNFAPVCDINSNANNPVINSRSFGEDRFWVAKLSTAFARGLESTGVMACAKHFPGHGDTDSDSHKTLPTVGHSLARLDSVELYPFKELFNYGIASVMVAHLNIPAMEPSGVPSTLSSRVVKGWLKDSLQFPGLVFTDALNMRGVADAFDPGVTDLKALQAGADVLLFPMDVPKAIAEIEKAVKEGRLSEERINDACLKILKAKEAYALPGIPKQLKVDLELSEAAGESLRREIAKSSITLLKNDKEFLPIKPLSKDVLVIGLGSKSADFVKAVKKVAPCEIMELAAPDNSSRVIDEIAKNENVIIAIGGSNYKGKGNYGLSDNDLAFINLLAAKTKVGLLWLGNPYALQELNPVLISNLKTIVLGYENMEEQAMASAQAIFGLIDFKGKLPVSIGKNFKAGTGVYSDNTQGFFEEIAPERVGMSAIKLAKIDKRVEDEIAKKAMPGARLIVMRRGKTVYNKSFGSYTYANKESVSNYTLYDVASLTKILSTALASMKLYDQGLLDINAKLGDYLSWIPKESPYYNLLLKDLMLHQAGLVGWIPYFKDYMDENNPITALVSDKLSEEFPVTVAPGYYVKTAAKDSIFERILREPLRSKRDYLYSDLPFYFLKEIIETLTNKHLDAYVDFTFYKPMGLQAIGYNPLDRFDKKNIAPTEYDFTWRKQLLQGHVHDQGAALMGGVAGHAGIFSSAEDVAAIMQMLLNRGEFQGRRYLQESTVKLFTSSQAKDPSKNRRGLIFDKPVPDGGPGPTFDGISLESFGHSGFTGTLAWADPSEDLVYVFLSNRVYPSAENRKLIKNNVRSDIQKMIYESLLDGKLNMANNP